MMQVLVPSVIYFGIVFGVGFLLASIRIPFLLPVFGERVAELIETPFMLVAIFLSARWLVRKFRLLNRFAASIAIGYVAAALLLFIEFSVVLWIRGLSISEYMKARDPIAAIVYYAAVGIFAVMPAVFSYTLGREDE